MTAATPDKPSVLFVCIHNAGRSQMAAANLTHLSAGRIEVRSAGSAPADQGIDAGRPIRDQIRRRIEALIADLPPTT